MSTLVIPSVEPRADRRADVVAHRRIDAFGGIDILHATYVDHSFSPHLHEVFAIGVISRGANYLMCRGVTHLVQAGQMVVVEPGEMHTGKPAGKTGWTYRMLYPRASVVAAAMAADGDPPNVSEVPHFRTPVIDDPALADAFVRTHQALEISTCQLEQESRLLDVLRPLLRGHAERVPADGATARDHRAVAIVRDYLHAHYNQPVRLATLAALTGLSPFHLIRVFRSRVGLPPYSYLEQVRVARAQSLLCQGIPVSRVAFATGFSDQSHLTRHFKRVLGMTPGQYLRGARRR